MNHQADQRAYPEPWGICGSNNCKSLLQRPALSHLFFLFCTFFRMISFILRPSATIYEALTMKSLPLAQLSLTWQSCPWLDTATWGMEPVTQICALMGNQMGNFFIHKTMLNQLDIPRECQSGPFKVHISALIWHIRSSRIWAWPLLQTFLTPSNLKFYILILFNSITFVSVVPITWKSFSP